MTRGCERLIRALAVCAVMLLALALGADGQLVPAAAAESGTNSLTTQFPLGSQKLCCTSKRRRRATTPAQSSTTATRTTSVSSSTSTTSARSSRSHTTSDSPLLDERGDGSAMPFIVVGAVTVAGLIAAEFGRLSMRRRRRVRRRAHAAAVRAAELLVADERPVAEPLAADEEPVAEPLAADEEPVAEPLAADQEPVAEPLAAGDEPVADVPAAGEEHVTDPLAQLEREVLDRGAAVRAAAASQRSRPGDGAYRLGQVLYERGRLHEAAAAWRLAASRQHPKAEARLAELREETGDTDAPS